MMYHKRHFQRVLFSLAVGLIDDRYNLMENPELCLGPYQTSLMVLFLRK